MSGSLRRRLIVSLCCVMLGAWLATAYFTYLDTRRLIDEVVDSHLSQSANMLLTLLDRLSAAGLKSPTGIIVETDSTREFSFRIETGSAAPAPVAGYRDTAGGSGARRVFNATDVDGHSVEVAVGQDVRTGFAGRVAVHILHPLWIAIPLLAALIWATVRWGLRPLEKVAASVAQRSANHLDPLRTDAAPTEIMPLVVALNDLFARISRSRERDRRFAADAAHELRTPLAAIKAHAQVAQRATSLEECRQALDGVLAGVERGTRVVEQLLALARLDHAAAGAGFAAVDLAQIVRQTVIELAPKAAAKKIDLGLDAPEAAAAIVSGNADMLAVLVRNLIDNALSYTPQGGQVNVAVRSDGESTTLRVEDNGPGLTPQLRARVTDRFFRVAGTGVQGSGLGLSIVAAIAEMHGAQFALEDRGDGPGLCARLSVPVTTTAKAGT